MLPLFLNTIRTMKRKLKLVHVTDYNSEVLQEAIAEGRLYIEPKETSEATLREEGISQILEYVSRIDTCAEEPYCTHIRALWERLLHDPTVADIFFYTRYARNKGKPNWYSVTAIVFVLQANGVYKASVPAVSLHLMMEQTDKRNSIYTGSSMYYPEHAKIVLLKQLLTDFFTAGNSPSL